MTERRLFDYNRICEIRRLREQAIDLFCKANLLSEPVLKSSGGLTRVYEIFIDHMTGKYRSVNIESPIHRKRFLAVALFLYSPGTMAGCKMKIGLREQLATIMKLKTHTTVSSYIGSLMVLYHSYRSFRNDVEEILEKVYKDGEMQKFLS